MSIPVLANKSKTASQTSGITNINPANLLAFAPASKESKDLVSKTLQFANLGLNDDIYSPKQTSPSNIKLITETAKSLENKLDKLFGTNNGINNIDCSVDYSKLQPIITDILKIFKALKSAIKNIAVLQNQMFNLMDQITHMLKENLDHLTKDLQKAQEDANNSLKSSMRWTGGIAIGSGLLQIALAIVTVVTTISAAVASGGALAPLAVVGLVISGVLITDGLVKIYSGLCPLIDPDYALAHPMAAAFAQNGLCGIFALASNKAANGVETAFMVAASVIDIAEGVTVLVRVGSMLAKQGGKLSIKNLANVKTFKTATDLLLGTYHVINPIVSTSGIIAGLVYQSNNNSEHCSDHDKEMAKAAQAASMGISAICAFGILHLTPLSRLMKEKLGEEGDAALEAGIYAVSGILTMALLLKSITRLKLIKDLKSTNIFDKTINNVQIHLQHVGGSLATLNTSMQLGTSIQRINQAYLIGQQSNIQAQIQVIQVAAQEGNKLIQQFEQTINEYIGEYTRDLKQMAELFGDFVKELRWVLEKYKALGIN